jgi:hemin uptake protein HemP
LFSIILKSIAMSSHDQPTPPRESLPEPPRIDVHQLLGEGREAILVHNGEPYRLRVTANNKLILTK